MTINEYQTLAMRTLNPKLSKKDVLINGVMGLCGESGEAIDLVKKHLAQGHELDREALIKELAASQDVFLGDCNHSRAYTPEYKFVLLEPDGSETLLQDYGEGKHYACEKDALDGQTLRLYARIADHEDNGEVWYDLLIE